MDEEQLRKLREEMEIDETQDPFTEIKKEDLEKRDNNKFKRNQQPTIINPYNQPIPQNRPTRKIIQKQIDLNKIIEEGEDVFADDWTTHFKYIYERAIGHARPNGIVASMPNLIAMKAIQQKNSCWGFITEKLWFQRYCTLSEENVGIDKTGKFVNAGNPVLITVHGCGIITPYKIDYLGQEETEQNFIKLKDQEIDDLINGILPDGKTIDVYTINDVIQGNIPTPQGRYAIAQDFKTAQLTKSGFHTKKEFMQNPVVLARAGTLEYLEKYFDKAKNKKEELANQHPFIDMNYHQPQGQMLILYPEEYGLANLNCHLNESFGFYVKK